MDSDDLGSPPRAWGPRSAVLHRHVCGRFTPTGVGTTVIGSSVRTTRTVHPHGRGDHVAHGGATSGFSVHPHGRGDHVAVAYQYLGSPGSPPRAWGPLNADHASALMYRFTPTGVGTTWSRWRCPAVASVHPHGRGDHTPEPMIGASSIGSPPRAWGPRLAGRLGRITGRFTPTGVGTTSPTPIRATPTSVHPHGRGDHPPRPPRSPAAHGSPPRAWGPQQKQKQKLLRSRFTPTGVGTTVSLVAVMMHCPVHPHGRGDH